MVQRGAKYSVCKCSHGLTVWIPSRTLSMGFPGHSWLDRGRSSPQLSRTPSLRALREKLGWREVSSRQHGVGSSPTVKMGASDMLTLLCEPLPVTVASMDDGEKG